MESSVRRYPVSIDYIQRLFDQNERLRKGTRWNRLAAAGSRPILAVGGQDFTWEISFKMRNNENSIRRSQSVSQVTVGRDCRLSEVYLFREQSLARCAIKGNQGACQPILALYLVRGAIEDRIRCAP
jgi:hypothetical protein